MDGELSFEELNRVGGNPIVSKVVSQATILFDNGCSKDEVISLLSQSYDLSIPEIATAIDELASKYEHSAGQISVHH